MNILSAEILHQVAVAMLRTSLSRGMQRTLISSKYEHDHDADTPYRKMSNAIRDGVPEQREDDVYERS